MVRGEAPDHCVGGEPGALSLLVHLDARGAPDQVVGIAGRRAVDLGRPDLNRGHGRGHRLGPGGRHLDGRELGDPGGVGRAGCALGGECHGSRQERRRGGPANQAENG